MHNTMTFMASSTTQIAANRLGSSWAWYVIRASGLTAMVLLIMLMISGIGHVTGWTYKFLAPLKAWMIHKAMGIALGVSVLVHMGGLLLDRFVRFGVADILVPFHKLYTNKIDLFGLSMSWIAIPAGIFAAYGVGVVILSSLDTTGWITRHKKLWKLTHLISYLVMFLMIFHVLGAGTDFKESGWRWLLILFGFLLLGATVSRLLRTKFLTTKSD